MSLLSPEQWRVIIGNSRSRLIGLGLILIGLIIGLIWAYGVAPTIWLNAEPVHLERSYQDEWVKMVAAQFAQTNDRVNAGRQLAMVGDAVSIIDRLISENAGDAQLVGRLNAIRPIAEGSGATSTNVVLDKLKPGFLQQMSPIVLVLIIGLVGAVAIIFWGMYGNTLKGMIKLFNPFKRRRRDESVSTVTSSAEIRQAREEAMRQREAETAAVVQAGGAPPVAQFLSVYRQGDDFFDDSFSIEDANNQFLGECGAGISETIGVGSPKKVTAAEVWLFDKNDIRTVTKVIMSQHAYNDEGIRAKLAPKGEPVLAQPGAQVVLETQTLRVVATIRDMEYGTGALPPNSFFERLTLDLAAYSREDVAYPV